MLVDMYIERIRRGSVSTRDRADVVSDRGCAVVLDAGHALGHLTGEQAMELAIERAKLSVPASPPCGMDFISAPPAATRNRRRKPGASASPCATRAR